MAGPGSGRAQDTRLGRGPGGSGTCGTCAPAPSWPAALRVSWQQCTAWPATRAPPAPPPGPGVTPGRRAAPHLRMHSWLSPGAPACAIQPHMRTAPSRAAETGSCRSRRAHQSPARRAPASRRSPWCPPASARGCSPAAAPSWVASLPQGSPAPGPHYAGTIRASMPECRQQAAARAQRLAGPGRDRGRQRTGGMSWTRAPRRGTTHLRVLPQGAVVVHGVQRAAQGGALGDEVACACMVWSQGQASPRGAPPGWQQVLGMQACTSAGPCRAPAGCAAHAAPRARENGRDWPTAVLPKSLLGCSLGSPAFATHAARPGQEAAGPVSQDALARGLPRSVPAA